MKRAKNVLKGEADEAAERIKRSLDQAWDEATTGYYPVRVNARDLEVLLIALGKMEGPREFPPGHNGRI